MRYLPWVAVTILAVHALTGADSDKVSFNRDIRPIMSDTCFRCHGPDKGSRMAGMRLDIREEALRPTHSNRFPIVPGDPDKSEIIERIFATNEKIMPPKFAHRELTLKQKDTAEGGSRRGLCTRGTGRTNPFDGPRSRN